MVNPPNSSAQAIASPGGTTAVIVFSLTSGDLAATPAKVTDVIPVKLLPLIVTVRPGTADAGLNDVICGMGTPVTVTFNLPSLD
jgi:hypothetical protein